MQSLRGCSDCGGQRVTTALADHLFTRKQTPRLQGAQNDLHGALASGAFGGQRANGRPSQPLIIRAIGQREHDELFAVRKGKRPNFGHNADAHPANLARSSRKSCAVSGSAPARFATALSA